MIRLADLDASIKFCAQFNHASGLNFECDVSEGDLEERYIGLGLHIVFVSDFFLRKMFRNSTSLHQLYGHIVTFYANIFHTYPGAFKKGLQNVTNSEQL